VFAKGGDQTDPVVRSKTFPWQPAAVRCLLLQLSPVRSFFSAMDCRTNQDMKTDVQAYAPYNEHCAQMKFPTDHS
jgi:hypothetical protein